MSGAARYVDDATRSVLVAHLAVGADGEPQRADEVHLDGEGVKQHGALEVVVGARSALDAGHQRRNVLCVGGGNGAAGVVDQNVESTVAFDDLADHCVDRVVIALVTHQLVTTLGPARLGVSTGNAVQRRARAADDEGTCPEQFVSNADSDTSTGAGHDRDLAVEHTQGAAPLLFDPDSAKYSAKKLHV